ncbi:dihydrodipicolinate synthase family protein [Streptomyces sp. NBC_00424]|uniref:dihydrodipicolinate synthase family protein n=1 Tax=Streptomyces sp. NBC_00424 TaxID=2903648 RepID=UPI002259C35C|nr:dihydrodipicolinate synthase family protein [Streptomyces sp. NBC_00424]MCX5078536.1 dihydrodipicolinate synthase family protein [Streptomyces sp. NBC_00424]
MSLELRLPGGPHRLRAPAALDVPDGPIPSRIVYAAAHVVADPLGENGPGAPAAVDWDSTLAFRRRLWSLGLGVADAMDTAQRGMGLDWTATRELITRSGAEARAVGGRLACGVGSDQLTSADPPLHDIIGAYREQLAVVEDAGARPILMASRALAAVAKGPEDYLQVYGEVIDAASQPVILHWLGEMFDPALAGYWGGANLDAATDAVLDLIRENAPCVDGIKVSLLDADREIALRRALPEGVRLYTGDDFNYPDLIRGDEAGHSDALLGIFDPIAAVAAAALRALDAGDTARYDALMEPTLPLARHLFAAPTYHYKTGVVFLAWLAGHQSHFTMVAGAQSGRSVPHLTELFRLADAAGVLPDPELAVHRMRQFLHIAGVDA